MKWKKLFKGLSIAFAITDTLLLAAIIGVSTIKNKDQVNQFKTINLALHHSDSIPVHFRYDSNSGSSGGYYPQYDHIVIHQWQEKPTIYEYKYGNEVSIALIFSTGLQTVHHELRHAFNKAQINDLHTNSDELSARTAEALFDKSLRHMFSQAANELQRRMTVSDFIPERNKTSHAYQELEKIMQEVSGRFYPSKDTVIMMERDINYILPELNQDAVDEILILGMNSWQNVRDKELYKRPRKSDILNGNTFTSDADLEKWFTFKINGMHRSLYKEASPAIRNRVRRMANADDAVSKALYQLNVLGRE